MDKLQAITDALTHAKRISGEVKEFAFLTYLTGMAEAEARQMFCDQLEKEREAAKSSRRRAQGSAFSA